MAQLIGDELEDMLLGGQRAHHFLAERLFLDVLDEVADHLDIYVGLEQGEADLAQGLIDIRFGDPAVPSELLENSVETIA
jgi:hypothetical protein